MSVEEGEVRGEGGVGVLLGGGRRRKLRWEGMYLYYDDFA